MAVSMFFEVSSSPDLRGMTFLTCLSVVLNGPPPANSIKMSPIFSEAKEFAAANNIPVADKSAKNDLNVLVNFISL